MSRVIVRPRAERDLAAYAKYIARDSRETALRFYDAAEQTFRDLAFMPHKGKLRGFKHPRRQDLRSWAIRGFPNHLIFYRPIPGGVEIVRVIHGSRNIDEILGP